MSSFVFHIDYTCLKKKPQIFCLDQKKIFFLPDYLFKKLDYFSIVTNENLKNLEYLWLFIKEGDNSSTENVNCWLNL